MPVAVPVDRVRALCDPYVNPWTDEPFSPAEVGAAISAGRLEPASFSADGNDVWNRSRHIERIAYLVVNGWNGPIEIDVGIPVMGFSMEWPVQDGNHRLAAAIYRGDATIQASVGGQIDYANELFGIDVTETEAFLAHATA